MTVEARSVSIPSLGPVKMEDTRKRTAVPDADDALPPPKRQATLVNGKKSEEFADWDPNVEVRGKPRWVVRDGCNTAHTYWCHLTLC
jgi:hypothetical protein